MMYKLAGELKLKGKVMLSTTTKIYIPSKVNYDFLCTDKERLKSYSAMKEKGIYILGSIIKEENKLMGLREEELEKLYPYFDYIILEADGAKGKGLKGWRETEPVIFKGTTKTFGIMDIQSRNIDVCEDMIHRCKIFCDITGAKEGEKVKLYHLYRAIVHSQGLFKGAMGERHLYLNKAETSEDRIAAKMLINKVMDSERGLLNKAFFGSLNKNLYFR